VLVWVGGEVIFPRYSLHTHCVPLTPTSLLLSPSSQRLGGARPPHAPTHKPVHPHNWRPSHSQAGSASHRGRG
jgi:hypothetical protein